MKEERTYIIIDTKTNKAIFGINNITMRFSTKEIAQEVVDCLFENSSEALIIQIKL